ncbi:MAG TPA: nuclear transport factor 2 family protein [Candidatus Wallbacteria bacterium]|nr:nuclear transport factor 2 family protein [Candidatus Wallbacteria bacterium]
MNNSSVKGVYKWNSASGSFISVLKNGNGTFFLDGVDPFLSTAQSYFIYIDSDSSFSCDNGYISFNSATSADEEAIRNIYSQFVTGIKTKNVTAIMSLYSDNYFHTGGDGTETKADRQARYTSINYSSAEGTNWYVASMKISPSSALVSVHCKTVLDGTVMEDETYNNDGTCYLAKENGKWVIVGNQKQWSVSGFTAHFPNNYFVEVYVDDPQHKITSVTVNGPGATNSSMTYGFYSHMPTRWAPNPMPSFGVSRPSTALTYTFTIISGGNTYTETLDLGNNFIDEAPEIISPADGATLSSKPLFQWKPVSFPGALYRVEIVDQNYNNIWNGDGDKTATSSEYSGTLSPGTYKWLVATKKSGSENVSFTSYRTFKVQ